MSAPTKTSRKRKWKKIRPHINPLSNRAGYFAPKSPKEVDWKSIFPNSKLDNAYPTVIDIGCGFGGLLEALSPVLKEKNILGMEIRDRVVTSVEKRIASLRNDSPDEYANISVMCTNVMRFFTKFFYKHSLEKLYFCFADPHFKKSNHRRRIISTILLDEYAYALKEGGKIYTITDVLDLHEWMVSKLDEHPMFERVSDEENAADEAVPPMYETDESKKVTRNNGQKYLAVYKKINPQ